MTEERVELPAYMEEIRRSIAGLDTEHRERATWLDKVADRVTGIIGRPRFLVSISLVILCWLAANTAAYRSGAVTPDPPPFEYLQAAASVAALLFTILILATQRRDDALADRREQLSLQLAILSEQKSAKIIELIEELRRDSPSLHNREDHQAAAMAESSGPQSVLDAVLRYRESPEV